MKRIFSILFAVVLVISFSLIPATSVGASPGPGIAGLWHFDEGSGMTASDSSGNGNTGTLTNGPTWVSGKFGSALSFDGSNDYVQVADDDTLDITTAITIEAWINPTTLGDWTQNDWKYIVSKRSGHVANYGFRLNGQKVEFYYRGSSGWQVWQSTSNVVSTGSWQHVAVAFTFGSGSVACYVNGTPIGGSWIYGTGTESATANTFPLRIGALYPGLLLPFDGDIDEVRIWNEARTANQIYQGYAALHVDDDGVEWPGAYPTITQALAVAGTGDTIIVHTGTYPESVVISTNDITLQGEGNPVLDGTTLGNVIAITIQADGVTVQNFEIRNYGDHGIRADERSDITLRHLNIHDVGVLPGGHNHAIDIRGGADVIIQNVRVAVGPPAPSWAEAIRLESIDGVQVINVDVDGGLNGVNFALGDDPDGPTNGVIKGSTFANNGFIAVFIANSTSATVKGNTVENAGMSGIYAGWDGAEVTGVVIQGNEVSGSSVYGITLGGASNSVVRGNEVSDSGVDGIALYPFFWNTDNNLVQGNDVTDSGRYGISVTSGATNNLIRGNTVSNSGTNDLYDDDTGDNTWKGNN